MTFSHTPVRRAAGGARVFVMHATPANGFTMPTPSGMVEATYPLPSDATGELAARASLKRRGG